MMERMMSSARCDTKESWSATPHDSLRLPSGTTIGQTKNLAAEIVGLIPGAAPDMGRGRLADLYAAHIAEVRAKGAAAAENDWLAAHNKSGK